jgi:hypothetical protein
MQVNDQDYPVPLALSGKINKLTFDCADVTIFVGAVLLEPGDERARYSSPT